MKRIKVKLAGKGTYLDPYRVQLPTYQIDCQRDVAGNPIVNEHGFPLDSVDYEKKICFVLVPDDEVDEYGKLKEEHIKEKYKEGWSKFKAEDVEVEA